MHRLSRNCMQVAKKRARYAADGPRVSQGFLKWASKRVGLVTTTPSVSFEVYENLHITAAGNPLINAFSPATRLQNLRCFEQHHNFYRDIPMSAFCDWLLEHAPSLEACSLGNEGSFLAASTLVFHNLKHLELKDGYIHSEWEDTCFKPAKQLPNLESLCMEGECTTHFEVFDVAESLHLRILAINGALAEVVLKPDLCQVSFAPQDGWENGELGCLDFEEWLGKACPLLGVADQMTLPEDFVSSQAARAGRFELFSCMSMLKLSWPDHKSDRNLSDTEESDSSNFYGQTEDYRMLLKNSMPIDGSPLLNLKVHHRGQGQYEGVHPSKAATPGRAGDHGLRSIRAVL